jgi:sec-independent protein translocase protein TatA
MGFMGLGPAELIVILVLAVLVFGPSKLPEIGNSLGKGIREFRKVTNEVMEPVNEVKQSVNEIKQLPNSLLAEPPARKPAQAEVAEPAQPAAATEPDTTAAPTPVEADEAK